jgi:hypothetical protein
VSARPRWISAGSDKGQSYSGPGMPPQSSLRAGDAARSEMNVAFLGS